MCVNDQQGALFIDVVQAGSFSKAAEENYVTPQSISQQIRRHERELGITLLERGPRGVVPTEAGKVIYQGCLDIKHAQDDLIARCRELGSPMCETIRFGQSSDHSLGFFTRILPEYLHRYPAANIEYVDVHHEVMFDELRADLYDVVESIRPTGPDTDDIGFTFLRHVGRCCLLNAKNPLARHAVIYPEDLRGQRVYVFSLDWAAELQDYLEHHCPDVELIEAPPASHFSPQKLCEGGNAVYLMPDHLRDRFEPLIPVDFGVDIAGDYGLVYLASKADWLDGLLSSAKDMYANAE